MTLVSPLSLEGDDSIKKKKKKLSEGKHKFLLNVPSKPSLKGINYLWGKGRDFYCYFGRILTLK